MVMLSSIKELLAGVGGSVAAGTGGGGGGVNCWIIPVERRMAPLSKHLSGVVLPVATFGTHLDSSGKTINGELERQNFKATAEILCDVWSEMTINGHQVFAQYIEKDAAELPSLPGEHWLTEHVRQSLYTLQIRKCGEDWCCGGYRCAKLPNFLPSFLPAPIPCVFDARGPRVAEEGDEKPEFGDLADRLALSSCFSEPICFDQYFPTMKDKYEKMMCKHCRLYMSSVKRKNAHEKACQEFEMDFMDFQDPEETVIEDEVDLAEEMRQSSEEKKAIAAELAYAFYQVRHNHSMNSMEEASQLIPVIFANSISGSRFASAGTKTTALVKGILYPHIRTMLIREINKAGYYSIGLDETPHSSRNIYALVVRYLSKDGVKNRVLQIIEMTSKKAVDQVEMVKSVLASVNLNPKRMVSFTADNTNSNFGGINRGGNNNVFAILKREINAKLIGIGCSSHIAHNSSRSATERMIFSGTTVEEFALMISTHFDGSRQRMDLLVEYAQEAEIFEVKKIPKHKKVRWLTLCSLVCWIYQLWPALTLYFKNCNEGSQFLQDVFGNMEMVIKFKTVISFGAFVLGNFNRFNAKTQISCYWESTLTIPELIDDVRRFQRLLQGFRDKSFFGADTTAILNQLQQKTRKELEEGFMKFYNDALNYFMEWFSFLLVECSKFNWLRLDADLSFNEISSAYKYYISQDAEELNSLLEEIIEVEANLEKLAGEEKFIKLDLGQKWGVIFLDKNIVHLKKLVSALLSIFSSNAYCESIFSIMNALWTDEKNSFLVSTINAFICVKCNFERDSVSAYEYFLGHKNLLDRAKAGEKYGYVE